MGSRNVGRVVGEIELGGGAAEAEQGCVESPGGLVGGVVGAEPYTLPAVGEAYFGDVLAPLPQPDTFVLDLVGPPRPQIA